MRIFTIPEGSCVIGVRRGGGSAEALLRRALPDADVLHVARYRIGFSDDPRSRESALGGFEALKREMVRRLLADGDVAVDGDMLRDDQVNHLRKVAPAAWSAGLRLDFEEDGSGIAFERVPSPTDRRGDPGPFDIVGDPHGCLDELLELLASLGYAVSARRAGDGQRRFFVSHPGGRRIAFVGDLSDRGPDSVGCLALAMDALESGAAVWTLGNHDWKLMTWLDGGKVTDRHGFTATKEQMSGEPEAFRSRLSAVLASLPSHLLLDGGALVVAHAGCREEMQGRDSPALTSFCMFGAATGEMDARGLPVRGDWAKDYSGRAVVVHGHTPLAAPAWSPRGNVICVDTGCAFGGSLTALRWPERELVSVPARNRYFEHPDFPADAAAGPRA